MPFSFILIACEIKKFCQIVTTMKSQFNFIADIIAVLKFHSPSK